jgi:hypothetical protein
MQQFSDRPAECANRHRVLLDRASRRDSLGKASCRNGFRAQLNQIAATDCGIRTRGNLQRGCLSVRLRLLTRACRLPEKKRTRRELEKAGHHLDSEADHGGKYE